MPQAILVRDARYPIGGFETWVEMLAERLPERGIDVTLLAPRSDDPAKEILDELRLRAARGEHGVVFTGGYGYLNVVGINLVQSPWVPVPVLHGDDPGAAEWFAIGPPRKLVAPSRALAADLHAALAQRVGRLRAWRRVTFIPHGVEVPDVQRGSPRLPLEVVVVSRFEEEVKRASDYVRIIDAAAHLSLRFTLIGDGSALPAMREALRERARFTGALSRARVYEELLRADILLSASSSEAFGLAIAEALACGCHVIAADAGPSVRELLENDVVPVGDIGAFVSALETLAANPTRNTRGAQRMREHYSAEAMAGAYAALIGEIRSRPNRRWNPPLHRTPSDALPRTFSARVSNWLRSLGEVLS